MKKLLTLITCASLFLSACSTIPKDQSSQFTQPQLMQRVQKLQNLTKWQVRGKIAFIQASKRESASVFWQVNESDSQQELKLTTYLGINVLNLSQANGEVVLEVEGKDYKSNDVDSLIYQLTGLNLPTKALHSWIKALPYSIQDQVIFNANALPQSITSSYLQQEWQIQYQAYRQVDEYLLPNKMTIKQGDTTIKLAISQWTID